MKTKHRNGVYRYRVGKYPICDSLSLSLSLSRHGLKDEVTISHYECFLTRYLEPPLILILFGSFCYIPPPRASPLLADSKIPLDTVPRRAYDGPMRPIKEYRSLPNEVYLRELGELPKEERAYHKALRREDNKILAIRSRIEKFIQDRGQCAKIDLIRGLNVRKGRLEPAVAATALGEMLNEGVIKTEVGSSSAKGGRRGVIITWIGTQVAKPVMTEERYQEIIRRCPPPTAEEMTAVMPNAILEELAADPRSEQLTNIPGNGQSSIDRAKEVPAKISLDNKSTPCEDAQVAEFRNTLKHEPAPAVEAQKTRRSALLEGLGS